MAQPGGALRILMTNYTLASRTGTEINVRDWARELAGRGHLPVVYTPDPGEIADEIRASGIPVASRVADVTGRIDLIHGQHRLPILAAASQFPATPIVGFCNDAEYPHDGVPVLPTVRRFAAVDVSCRERLLAEGAPPERVRLYRNGVDLNRFGRRRPLPERPRRALIFSNATAHADAVRDACRRTGIEVDAVGAGFARTVARPEDVLGRYDLVFARSRAALESLATGCAVILCDELGLGNMVASDDLDRLLDENLCRRALSRPVTSDAVVAQIDRYDALDAHRVTDVVRARCGLDHTVDTLVALYRETLADAGPEPEPADAAACTAAAIERMFPPLSHVVSAAHHARDLEARLAQAEEAGREATALRDRADRAERTAAEARSTAARAADEAARARTALDRLERSVVVRARRQMLGVPLVRTAVQRVARALDPDRRNGHGPA